MKKICLLFLLIVMSFSSLFAVATVKDFFGKVKIKYDGDTKWSRVSIGMELPPNATVSTGFNSQIILDLGNATLDVLPLTRMTVGEITESQDTINTSLFLQGGKIKADVKKIEGKVNDFKIKSPVATASVRGTAFEFSGNTLKVIRGEVAFVSSKRAKVSAAPVAVEGEEAEEAEETPTEPAGGVSVKAGGGTQMASADARPVKPQAMAEKNRTVEASTKPPVVKLPGTLPLGGPGGRPGVPRPGAVQSAITGPTSITITINIEG